MTVDNSSGIIWDSSSPITQPLIKEGSRDLLSATNSYDTFLRFQLFLALGVKNRKKDNFWAKFRKFDYFWPNFDSKLTIYINIRAKDNLES